MTQEKPRFDHDAFKMRMELLLAPVNEIPTEALVNIRLTQIKAEAFKNNKLVGE